MIGAARVLGAPRAIEAFHAAFFPDVDAAVAAMRAPRALADEVKQLVSQKLLVAQDGAAPRIGDYAGRGHLRTWVRVIGARMLVSLLRRGNREVGGAEDALLALPGPADDPELALIKRQHRAALKAALHEAVAALAPRPRTLLRQSLIDGLTIDDLGRLYRVHRVTAARWLVKARQDVWAETRRVLAQRLGADATELDSFLRQGRSQLDLSLDRLLRTTAT